jgi:uncharacterized protein
MIRRHNVKQSPKLVRGPLETARRERFNAARRKARSLSGFLVRAFHARRVVLIGSLLDEQRFDIHSDIDLCVEGIPPDSYFRAVGEALMLADPFSVDLVPLERVNGRMREDVKNGRVLYGKA